MGLPSCHRQAHSANATYAEARASLQQGDLDRAERLTEDAQQAYHSDPRLAWRFLELKAEILMQRGRSKDSLALLLEDPPAALARDEAAVRRRMTQATDCAMFSDFAQAERYVDAAEQLARRYQPTLLGEVAANRGSVALYRNDNVAAEAALRQALQLARDARQPQLEGKVMGNLGIIYGRRQRYGEAIEWFQASLKLAQSLGNRGAAMRAMSNLGWNYYQLGDLDGALEQQTLAVNIARELGLERDEHYQLILLGETYESQRRHVEAENSYRAALAIARKLQNRSRIGVSLSDLALVALEQGKLEQAEAYEREALALRREDKERNLELHSLYHLARITSARRKYSEAARTLGEVIRDAGDDVPLRWQAEAELAKVHAANRQPQQAEAQFRRSLATVESLRSSVAREDQRLSFLNTATDLYGDYIDFLVTQGRGREALRVAERSRALTLAEGLGIRGTRSQALLLQPESIAKRLNAVILSYWLKPGNSYLWAVTPSQMSLQKLPPEPEIEAALQAYRKALTGPRDPRETANPDGQALYRMLIGPVEKLIRPGRQVIIVADGKLHSLNFETLLAPSPHNPAAPNPGAGEAPLPHYWIEDVLVANASSIAMLQSGRSPAPTAQGLLLFGDAVSPGGEYSPLPQARPEVEKVQAHFPAAKRVVVTGESATPAAYLQNRPERYRYMHFVAHGAASRLQPLDSGVILSRGGDGAYKLYARDIMRQPLQAELVTISACYGAGTRTYSGEGLVGLSWSFLRAGAHHVIASLWEVNDASTPQLMDDLYGDLTKGRDPVMALHNAKIAMLRSGGVYRRPFYWGAFQVYLGS